MAVNKVMLSGNLTRDPELKSTPSGQDVCAFGIAVNNRKKEGEQWVDDPAFYDCEVWGKRAESLSRFLAKGRKVVVIGRLKQDRWERDGQKHVKDRVVCEEVEFMDSGRDAKPAEAKADDTGLADADMPF